MAANWVYTPEEKLKIVLEGMSGTISVADLCRKYDLKPARFNYWKDQPRTVHLKYSRIVEER